MKNISAILRASQASAISVFLMAVLTPTVLAQVDLSGTWRGNLVVGADNEIEVQFSFERNADQTYTGLLNAPDQPSLSNIAISSLTLEQDTLTLLVDDVSGSYVGTLVDGSFQGTWTQQGTSFPLDLSPLAEQSWTPATMDRLMGSWVGALHPTPEVSVAVVFRFELNDEGEFVAYLDLPERGQFGVIIDQFSLAGDELSLRRTESGMKFTGSVTESGISGTWVDPSITLPLEVERGRFEIEGLALTPELMEKLEGRWQGKVGPLTLVLRFEEGEEGKYSGYLDSPDQGVAGIPITEVEIDGDQLIITVTAVRGTFTAQIMENELTGTWRQGPGEQPLTMTKTSDVEQ